VNSELKSAADFDPTFQELKNKVARIQEDLGLN
jgi:hypothetical protein